MKSLLSALLLVSLAGNAALAVFAYRQSVAATPAGARTTAGATGGPPAPAPALASPSAAAPINWQTLKPGADLHALVTNLRAAGFPPAVIRAVVNQMVADRLDTAGVDHLPFWKQNPNNPEYLAAQQQLAVQRREMFSELLGADARPSAMMDPAARERRFGSLSDEKIDQIDNITRDFNEMRMKLYAARKSDDPQNMMGVSAAMEQEMKKELATVLTPAELEQYEMRSSPSSSKVMTGVKNLDVTEAEFTALFRAQKAFDEVDPLRSGVVNTDAMALRNTAQAQLNEQARAILTDDRFYDYLKGTDPNYARTAQFTANYPSISPAMTYELTQIERDYQTSMMALSRAGAGMPAADRMAQGTAARQAYQDKLNTLLGPETAAAYAQRNRPGVITTTSFRVGP